MDNSSLIAFMAVIVSIMSLWISLDSLRRARKMEQENKRLGDFSKATNALLGIDMSDIVGAPSSSVVLPVEYVPGQSAYQTLANYMGKENAGKSAEMVIIDFIDGERDITVDRLIEFYTAFPEYEYHLRQAYHLYCMDGNGRSGQSIANQVLNPDAEVLKYE